MKLFKGGSYAKTFLIKKNNKLVVRKEVSKNVDYLRGECVLKGQYLWLKFANKNSLSVPKTLNFNKNKTKIFYDMQYINNSNLFSSLYLNKNKTKIFEKILDNINLFHKKNLKIEKANKYLFNYLYKKKVIPSVKLMDSFSDGKALLKRKYFIINNQKCLNILSYLNNIYKSKKGKKKFLKERFDSKIKSIIHGDLTFENILIRKNNFYFIDPLGSFMDQNFNGNFLKRSSIYFDLAKMCQSILANFESWKDINKLNFKISDKKITLKYIGSLKSKNFQKLLEKYKFLDENLKDILIIHLSIILCRIIRYKVNNNLNSSYMCYIMATYWINQIKVK